MTTTHRISTAFALALALAATAAPAGARPYDLNGNGSYVPAGSASMQAASQPTNSTRAYATPRTFPRTVIHVASDGARFDWGDAGIGAAGGLGLALVGVGGAFALSRQRQADRIVRRRPSPADAGTTS